LSTLLDEINERGEAITVTRWGRPVATLKPVKTKRWKSPFGAWAGKVEIVGDIVNTNDADSWEVLHEADELLKDLMA
jgi:antitoxin (DNA-binding transcriptional repressor) of toxin-antitoxin stability system